MKALIFFLSLCWTGTVIAQKTATVSTIAEGTKGSLRGLSVVNDKVIWTSGSNGTVGKSVDGGKSWKWLHVKGFEQRDFRDIEAFDATKAIIMAVDAPAFILKTIDGGDTWKVVYENGTTGMFLDAMEFWNDQSGIVIGDPIAGKIFIARTFDGGATWKEIPDRYKPTVDSGEAFFAASGTNVRVLDKDEAVMVSGGLSSRLFVRDQKIKLPLLQGSTTTGANSIAVLDKKKYKGGNTMIVVGGDFNNPSSDSLNCFISHNRGKTWNRPATSPTGYRSCVEYISENSVVTCGINGVDFSEDGGQNWRNISATGFNTVRKAKEGKALYLCGGNGRIGKLELK